jgi:hypothetical protein
MFMGPSPDCQSAIPATRQQIEGTNLVDPLRLDATELLSARLSRDRKYLRLKLRDQTGRTVSL